MTSSINRARWAVAAGLVVSALALNAQTLTNGLYFYAPFSGSLNDVAGGRTGTGMNGPTLRSSGGVGNGGFVQLANDPVSPKQAVWYADPTPASNDFSFQIWVRAADADSAQNGQVETDFAIAANKDWGSGGNVGWVLARQDGNDGGQFQWNLNTAGGTRKDFDPRHPRATVFDGAWHQLTVTYQRNGNATFYRDGAVIGAVNIAANTGSLRPSLGLWVTNNILALGEDATLQYWHGSGAALNGDVDETAMWDRVLSASEVLTAYMKGTNGLALTQPLAPVFLAQPQGGTRYASDNFLLSAEVAGDRGALRYQWFEGQSGVAGATDRTLLLTNLVAGTSTYRLVVSDSSGSVTSAPAVLTVLSSANILDGIGAYLNLDDNISAQAGTTVSGAAIGLDPTPKYTAGRIGSAARFNNDASASGIPTDWAVSLGDIESIYSNNWSFSLWVNLTNNLNGALFGNKDWTSGGNVGWVVAPYNNIAVNYYAQGGPRRDLGAVNVRNGEWRQLAAVFNRDANRVDLYVDGSWTASNPLGFSGWESLTPDNFTPNDTLIGGSGTGPFSGAGAVDDVGVWQRLLTPAEILAIYSQGRNGQPLTTAEVSGAVRPAISEQPASMAVYVGRPVTLSVKAAGTPPLVYAWYKNQQPVPGATSNTLSFVSVSAGDAGSYTVVVSNSAGSVTSAPPAVLSVLPVASVQTALAVYLNLDSNINAQAGTTNNGTPIGAPTYGPGRIGPAALFNNDGSSSYTPSDWAVSLGNIEWIYGGNWSFSLWVNATVGNDGALFGNKDWNSGGNIGWLFVPTRQNSLNYTAQGGSRHDIGGPTTLDGRWHHVVAVFDRDRNLVSYYIDAVPVAAAAIGSTGRESLTPGNILNDTLIGASGPARWAGAGAIDDVGIWTRPLALEEVIGIYLKGLEGKPLTEAVAGDFLPTITAQPVSITRYEGLPANFSVAATGTAPLRYQWRRDGVNILNATNASLAFPVTLADEGAVFSVAITNQFGHALSSDAVLTVVPAPAAVTAGLAVYLNFDSNMVAQAGTGVNGTAAGNVGVEKYAAGVIGAAARFDNDNGDAAVISDWAVSLGDIEWLYTNNFSFAFWVKTTDTDGAVLGNKNWNSGNNIGWCVSRYRLDWLNYRAADAPRHDIGNFDWADDAWHHLAAVFYRDANMVYTYVDGNLTAAVPLGNTGLESLTPEEIRTTLVGSSGNGAESGYGLVDDLGIWTRPLSQDTLRMIYQSGLRGQAVPQASPGQVTLSAALVGDNIVIRYPAWASHQTLEGSPTLLPAGWTSVAATPLVVTNTAVVTLPATNSTRFFRLRQ